MTTSDLASWPADPRRAALVLDFDGTLAPIVDDPAASRMPSATAQVVSRIAGRIGRVAIVSGRPARFLQQWAPIPKVLLVGLYGLEQVRDAQVVADPRIAEHASALVRARGALFEIASAWPGAELEDKGNAMAVHWRRADDVAGAGAAVPDAVRAIAAQEGLHAEDGKMVMEIRPPVPADKGTAVTELTKGFTEVAFAGDDVGDLPAFEVVNQRSGLTIAVDHGQETDPRVLEAASLVVNGVTGMRRWLTGVADRLDPPS